MGIDTDQLEQLRLMRDYIGASVNIADAMNDTLLAALLSDIEHTLSGRVKALVTSVMAASPTATAHVAA